MIRRLATILVAISLLLFLSTLLLWPRTHRVRDMLTWHRPHGAYYLRTCPGHLVVGADVADWTGWPADRYGLKHETNIPVPADHESVWMMALNVDAGDTWIQKSMAGFTLSRWASRRGGTSITLVVIPLWSIAILTGLPPALWLVALARRRRRARQGICPECNYDLRATPHRCPECGWTTARPSGL